MCCSTARCTSCRGEAPSASTDRYQSKLGGRWTRMESFTLIAVRTPIECKLAAAARSAESSRWAMHLETAEPYDGCRRWRDPAASRVRRWVTT